MPKPKMTRRKSVSWSDAEADDRDGRAQSRNGRDNDSERNVIVG